MCNVLVRLERPLRGWKYASVIRCAPFVVWMDDNTVCTKHIASHGAHLLTTGTARVGKPSVFLVLKWGSCTCGVVVLPVVVVLAKAFAQTWQHEGCFHKALLAEATVHLFVHGFAEGCAQQVLSRTSDLLSQVEHMSTCCSYEHAQAQSTRSHITVTGSPFPG